jgi:hypothetical protein
MGFQKKKICTFPMTAVAITRLKGTFLCFAEQFTQDQRLGIINKYALCLELMRGGVLDKDAKNSSGFCFGTVVICTGSNYVQSTTLLAQWMALEPFTLLKPLKETMDSTHAHSMFWKAFEQVLEMRIECSYFVDCLQHLSLPIHILSKLQVAGRFSPLRRAWIQAVVL